MRILRNMICLALGCSPCPVAIGEEIIVSDRTLQELSDQDVLFLARETALAYDI